MQGNINIENNNTNVNTNEIVETKKEEKVENTTTKNMVEYVNNVITKHIENGLQLAPDYNVQNAVISSYLIISQDEKLSRCTKSSIANSLVDMVTLSLNVSKKQGDFIAYENKKTGQLECKFQTEYAGNVMVTKRMKGVKDVISDVLYKDTKYELVVDEYGNEDIKITEPCPLEKRTFENIIGAWAKVILDEEIFSRKVHTCIMLMDRIERAWSQGAMKGQSPAHKNFKDEMCKKSVINRCCKLFVRTAKDNDILVETFNRVTSNEYEKANFTNNVIGEAEVIDV